MIWRVRGRSFDLTERCLVMGIVNLTTDSFSDGGRFIDPTVAIDHARRLADEGADLVDLGAESTRPGAEPVPAEEQMRRLAPVLEELARDPQLCLSVDTASAGVAEAALGCGAHVVNDVTALRDPRMAPVVRAAGAGVVLMHLRGTPMTMQHEARYQDVTREVRDELAERIAGARAAGIAEESIVIDPGIGFAKTGDQSLEILGRLDELLALGRPVLVGASRKSFLGKLLGLPVEQRVQASAVAAALAVFQGARIIRTHDVAPTLEAVRLASALHEARRARQSTRA